MLIPLRRRMAVVIRHSIPLGPDRFIRAGLDHSIPADLDLSIPVAPDRSIPVAPAVSIRVMVSGQDTALVTRRIHFIGATTIVRMVGITGNGAMASSFPPFSGSRITGFPTT
jgi:hypothetical protein